MISNYHTHCCFCDGSGQPEEYVLQALKKDFSTLGFSSHGPIPFTEWTMRNEDTGNYLETIDYLKSKYTNLIQIYKGMEIDYLSGDTSTIFKRYDLDYIIGAVHLINDGIHREYFSIDGNITEFQKTFEICSNSSIKKLVSRYYETVLEMLQNNRIDILAHLDLVKKNNTNQKYFNETDAWYVNLVKDVVRKISSYNVIVEVNTGGIARGYTDNVYPSLWIIKEMKKWNIPIVLSSDAHKPENLDFYFDQAKEDIKSAGYDEVWDLNNGKWENRKL